MTVTPQIDVTREGTPLADVAFTATNAAPTETLVAAVSLEQATSLLQIFRGPIATAKVAPDSVLLPADAQTVSIQASAGTSLRSLRRPFQVGGNTEYTLPAPVVGARWEVAAGNLSASWSAIPDFGVFSIDVSGASDPTKFQNQYLFLSPRFVAATGITSATIDTDIPGFKPEWRVSFTRSYFRRMFVQRVVNSEISSSLVSEQITALTALASPAGDRPLPHDRIAPP